MLKFNATNLFLFFKSFKLFLIYFIIYAINTIVGIVNNIFKTLSTSSNSLLNFSTLSTLLTPQGKKHSYFKIMFPFMNNHINLNYLNFKKTIIKELVKKKTLST